MFIFNPTVEKGNSEVLLSQYKLIKPLHVILRADTEFLGGERKSIEQGIFHP